MCLSPVFHRSAAYCGSLIVVVLLNCVPAFSQVPKAGQSFPTQDNPRIVISNPSTVSIIPWDKREVSVIAEVSGEAVHAEELTMKPENNKLNITCNPSKPDRNITLTLSVPSKAVLEIKAHGNIVEIKEPGHISSTQISSGKDKCAYSISLDRISFQLVVTDTLVGRYQQPTLAPHGWQPLTIRSARWGIGTVSFAGDPCLL